MLGPHEHIVGFDCERDTDQKLASEMLATLVRHYPGYEWFLTIKGGVVHVKIPAWSDVWGMSLHYKDVAQDATIRDGQLVRAAGEFLERAHMIRGHAEEGKRLQAIEGVPDKALARAKIMGA